MKIKMVKLAAGPLGCREIGKVYEVPDVEAKELISAGAAFQVDARGVRVAAVETAKQRKEREAKEKHGPPSPEASADKLENAERADKAAAELAEKRSALEDALLAAGTAEEEAKIQDQLDALERG